MTRWRHSIRGFSVLLLFLGMLLWARGHDPFYRKWFSLRTPGQNRIGCVAVLPKPVCLHPVIIYVHDSGSTLLNDGNDLRQMAELGFAAVTLEADIGNEKAFESEFMELLGFLGRQSWADTNAIVWVGFGAGATCARNFALHHADRQPQLLVQMSMSGINPEHSGKESGLLHCPLLIVQPEHDQKFSLSDTFKYAYDLQSNGVAAEVRVVSGSSHELEPYRAVVFRNLGEYCRTRLVGIKSWSDYRSVSEWQAAAAPLWLYCLPAAIVGISTLFSWRSRLAGSRLPLDRRTILLRSTAVVLTIWALALTAIHIVTPSLKVNHFTLSIARRFLVRPVRYADFQFLAAQPIWDKERLGTFLDHIELAAYDRELANWRVDDQLYREFVLSPVITDSCNERLEWRRSLWEQLYPYIRHESSTENAVRIIVQQLRGRVTIAGSSDLPHDVPTISLRQITDEVGFEIIYVAALRSVGIPSRLNSIHQAEFWDGNRWQPAFRPVVMSEGLPSPWVSPVLRDIPLGFSV